MTDRTPEPGRMPEPDRTHDRQGREMPHVTDLAHHADHDQALIAAYAAGDAQGPELDTAASLVAGCAACADLHRDLRAIQSALADLPAPVRPRDFRLTAEQAAGLRPRGWRTVLATLAGPRFSFAAPLGATLATMGLVGVLVAGPGAAILPTSGGTAATNESVAAPLAPAPAASGAPGDNAYANATMAPTGPGEVPMPSAAPSAGAMLGQGDTAAQSLAPGSGSDLAGGGEEMPAATAANGANPPGATQKTDVGAPVAGLGASTPGAQPTGPARTALGDRDTGDGGTNQLPLILAAALLVVGLGLAGIRLVARRAV